MPIAETLLPQVDFTGGQINGSAKRRSDLPVVASAGLQMLNFRAEAQGSALQRPGRRALYPTAKRSEYFRMSEAVEVRFNFWPGRVQITTLAGDQVANFVDASLLWVDGNASLISFAQATFDIVICFPAMRPLICRWNHNDNTWTFVPFDFSVVAGNKQEPFFRASSLGSTMSWSAATSAYLTIGASMTLTCSGGYFLPSMIGSRLSILGGQVTITAVASTTVATVTVNSRLPDTVEFSGVDVTAFAQGQVAATTNSGLKFEVISAGSGKVRGPLMNGAVLLTASAGTADTISSPTSSSATSGYALYSGVTATLQWQEEFMSSILGWPAACFYGNGRLGFCRFPQRQEAILWCAIGSIDIAYIDSTAAATNASAGVNANSAILEYVKGRPKVLNVVDTGDEFIFTDRGIYFIPISADNPLKPGSVEFRLITNDGVSPVRPVPFLDAVIYVNAGGTRISVIRATGAVTRPYSSDDISDVHSDLFKVPIALAVTAGDGAPERLAFVVNADGSLVVGKFSQAAGIVGWHPEASAGRASWVVADGAKVYYNTTYSGATLMEVEDASQKVDCAVMVNSLPANMVQAGFGPFWWVAGGIVTLALNGVDLGDRSIDGTGNIVRLQGEVLDDMNLIGGTGFSKTFEPIVRMAAGGPSQHQRQRRRRISQAMITVQSDCEFDWGATRVPAYNFDDDGSAAPMLREQSVATRPLGRDYDPRVILDSKRFGTIRIMECSVEASI